ncbi:BAR-domain-containing protein [Hortaea werneckii]|nr:BAR-domain-containing protein [Hortaea werneckii]KAI7076187.1 BAR-domain-containing protein [Hortaea werneckii]KAI7229375.1 BAR-domain-containing protein [Hortaea werneckii]KAI7304238.1 BAR-domain-containing protein [Hortaea werneckii]KAI7390341.1 BAR-domain-containing protein [Hortaea werneckii]
MSWNGFKKATSRMGTQVMMKTGHVERTTDRSYEVEERRYRSLEGSATRLQKEAKGYLDSLRAMTASQMRIAETIDAFYGESGAKDGVSRSYKQAVEDLDAETLKALDGPYRTTVLEPINRFCAYFPDINECIKKRNHKMLDYDAMRSKVKKLTDKPDKDPGKLPRTEKELEMVSLHDFLSEDTMSYPKDFKKRASQQFNTATIPEEHEDDMLDFEEALDLSVPSPPKVCEAVSRVRRQQQEEEAGGKRLSAGSWARLARSSCVLSRVPSIRRSARSSVDGESLLQRSSSVSSNCTSPPPANTTNSVPPLRESSTETLPSPASSLLVPHGERPARSSSQRTVSMPPDTLGGDDAGPSSLFASSLGPGETFRKRTSALSQSPSVTSNLSSSTIKANRRHSAVGNDLKRKYSARDRLFMDPNPLTQATPRQYKRPFLQPSELDDIMQPLKEEYSKTQTDLLMQAKHAYEQLNDQLTAELPQLIDLRVPYLDPSFEALVKIQLRFCAEAYSRMAQVQQYLDASTRDQYANGDLDARVEDVLGQIRDLSIAGTV